MVLWDPRNIDRERGGERGELNMKMKILLVCWFFHTLNS